MANFLHHTTQVFSPKSNIDRIAVRRSGVHRSIPRLGNNELRRVVGRVARKIEQQGRERKCHRDAHHGH
jgi:hypothetical protein